MDFQCALQDLFNVQRSISGEGNRATLDYIQSIIPLKIHSVSANEAVGDWVVPRNWVFYNVTIQDEDGNIVLDANCDVLYVVNHSEPVKGWFTWEELRSRIYLEAGEAKHAGARPYRTSYYKRDWGLCLSLTEYNLLKRLSKRCSTFYLDLDARFDDEPLIWGEYFLPGKTNREVWLSTYICHPNMANDNLSGVLVTCALAEAMSQQKLECSYRFVFVPETIGALCAINKAKSEGMTVPDLGIVISTCGGPGIFQIKQSFDCNHPANRLVESVVKEAGLEYEMLPFDIHGSDERQYSAHGMRVNCITIAKDIYYKYPQYHTSLDDLDFVTTEALTQSLLIYKAFIMAWDRRKVYRSKIPFGEPMLGKRDLYPNIGGSLCKTGSEGISCSFTIDDLLWVYFYIDGRNCPEDIAQTTNLDINTIRAVISVLEKHGIIAQV